jgi:hypothetical protein
VSNELRIVSDPRKRAEGAAPLDALTGEQNGNSPSRSDLALASIRKLAIALARQAAREDDEQGRLDALSPASTNRAAQTNDQSSDE